MAENKQYVQVEALANGQLVVMKEVQTMPSAMTGATRMAEPRLTRDLTMQDVRLHVGEGPLTPADVLAGANAALRMDVGLLSAYERRMAIEALEPFSVARQELSEGTGSLFLWRGKNGEVVLQYEDFRRAANAFAELLNGNG